ncbi:MAG TPA: protein translocase subunit SecD [bacterium]
MQRNLAVKTVLILALIAWALYALYPTYKLQKITPEGKTRLADQGKLIPLIDRSIRLGLDLQGGIYMTLEVDLPRLIEQLAKVKDARLDSVLYEARQEMNVRSENFLNLLAERFNRRGIPLNTYWGERGESNGKVLSMLEKEASDAMDRSLEILRNRVDQFGVSEPNIQHTGSMRILIELPGISDPAQAKELIGKTALLEFCLVKDPTVFSDLLQKIDRALSKSENLALDSKTKTKTKTPPVDTTAAQSVKKESRDKTVSVDEIFGRTTESEAVGDTALQDTSALVDENLFKENPLFSLLRDTRQYGHEVSVPVRNITVIERLLSMPNIQRLMPPDAQFLWSSEIFKVGDESYRELFLVNKEPELTGKYLTSAQVTIGSDAENAGKPVVNFTLNRPGGRIFSRVTGANIKKRLAVVLDKKVYTAPVIQSKIPYGSGIITGMPDMDEAKLISIVLRAGALPAPVSVIEERTVGPSLGQDSIDAGKRASLIGLAAVIVFMVVYYRMSGLIADFALVLNMVLLMAALAQFRFTLTLPGIAGIVLTIGMAVDANVLIFERIREELRTGKTVRASIDAGYTKAFSAIFDSNLTTVFAAMLLYIFGTGPVRGFAVTLIIGLIVSLFTAIVVTRTVFDHITTRKTLATLSI